MEPPTIRPGHCCFCFLHAIIRLAVFARVIADERLQRGEAIQIKFVYYPNDAGDKISDSGKATLVDLLCIVCVEPVRY